MLEEVSGQPDGMQPDGAPTMTQQLPQVFRCFVQTPTYPLSSPPSSPLSPITSIVPIVYSPNDTVLPAGGDDTSKPTTSDAMSPSSPIYCNTYIGYTSPYQCVMYTMCPVVPIPLSSPSDGENYNSSESSNGFQKEADESMACEYEYPEPVLCPMPNYAAPSCLLVSREEESFEKSVNESASPPSIVTNLFPKVSDDGLLVTSGDECSHETKPETDSRDIGVFGVDGCWYPVVNLSANDSGVDVTTPESFHQSEPPLRKQPQECQQYNIWKRPASFNPSLLSRRTPASVTDTRSFSRLQKPRPQPSKSTPLPFYNLYHHLDLPTNILGRPRLLHTLRKDGQLCVEELWQKHMLVLFRNFRDDWVLSSAHPAKKFGPSWHMFKDLAKVRFYCRKCSDGWTSMYGVVVFYYRWDRNCLRGQIFYQIPGQKCGNCNPNDFEVPMWYPEEAQKVITNLYYKIAAHVYNLVTPQYIRTRRLGQPLAHHNRQLCQGCYQGVCKIECGKEVSSAA
ncbi:uncharacterized protein [Procambarus clarkii]|uniref:uncharacterized protein n=1 Tax=Procambarus clarkii TaxID=6728 RepID=UPI001E6716BC|nr:uncharacterized protein LOC123765096 [Procambarus clarkii]